MVSTVQVGSVRSTKESGIGGALVDPCKGVA